MVLKLDGNSEQLGQHEGTFGIFGEKKNRYVTAPGSIHKTKNIKDD